MIRFHYQELECLDIVAYKESKPCFPNSAFWHSRCIILSCTNGMKFRIKLRFTPYLSCIADVLSTSIFILCHIWLDSVGVKYRARGQGQTKDKAEPGFLKKREVLAATWHKYLQLTAAQTWGSVLAGLLSSLTSLGRAAVLRWSPN